MMDDIRVAAVISCSPVGKIRNNLANMAKWIEAAQKKDVSIICFPEMNITGYTNHKQILHAAETVPGPVTDELCSMANRMDMMILAGIAEKNSNENLFASHLVIKPGSSIDVYRKVHIPPPERTIFSPGNRIPQFEFRGLTFGIQLCYDAHFPELTTHMALDGADMIFMPHASPKKTPEDKLTSWLRHLPARAYDNSIFIVACNQTGHNGEGLHFPGLAAAISPDGKIINTYLSNDEGLLIVDLKSKEMEKVRNNRMHFFLPHRRPEVYALHPRKE